MTIGILYICTGKYSLFWEKFYQSCEDNFLSCHKKHYFVFTDSSNIKNESNVTKIYESAKGFPMDSLLRFKMFKSIENNLLQCDYLFFFNSNMLFVKPVNEEILPGIGDNRLVALLHPGYYSKRINSFPFERNGRSTAFIPYIKSKIYRYYMGSLNGGRTEDFIKLIDILCTNVDIDMSNGIIAIYHDESHLNSYLNTMKIKSLDPSYGFPENSRLPFIPKIIILDKVLHGGSDFDKLPRKALIMRIYRKLRFLFCSVIWRYW